MYPSPKILWITERHPPLKGGMAVSSARQVEGLRRRDLKVDVYAFTSSDGGVDPQITARDGGTDYHFSCKTRPGLTGPGLWHQVKQEQVKAPYTFAVGFGAGLPGFLAVTLAAWLDCPSLVLVRGNDFDQDWFDPHRGAWVREALQRATVIGAVASDQVCRLQALYPTQDIRLIHNGIEAADWELLPQDLARRDDIRRQLGVEDRRIIGLFGELKHKKGIPGWLGALRDTGLMDRVGLLVVGSIRGDDLSQLLQDITLSPINRQISYTSREELPGLYAACDFVALPSLYEGLPNVLLEAMCLGVIPLVSDAGAMRDVVRDRETGFIFPAGDRRAAAAATARALGLDAGARQEFSTRAKAFVGEKFSVQRETDTLCAILLAG